MESKKLPVGINSFEEIRKNNYHYVDRTGFIYEFLDDVCPCKFISRPPGFGKTLFLSTLEALFEGKKELFEGLEIYDKWEWEKEKRPVIRIDMTKKKCHSYEEFNEMIYEQLAYYVEKYEIDLDLEDRYERRSGLLFPSLIHYLYYKDRENPVRSVILIDEYERQVYDQYDNKELYEEIASFLRGFYCSIKASERYLKVSVLTGQGQFEHTGPFSGFNTLYDFTLKERYATSFGFTEEEVQKEFAQELESEDLEHLKEVCGGYSWDGEHFVFNPNDLIGILSKSDYKSTICITPLLENLMKRYAEEYGNNKDDEYYRFRPNFYPHRGFADSLMRRLDYNESLNIEQLLVQGGLITFKEMGDFETFIGRSSTLDFPNVTAKNAFYEELKKIQE